MRNSASWVINRWNVALLLLSISCGSALAQFRDTLGVHWNNPLSASVSTMVMRKAREDALARELGANVPGDKAPAAQRRRPEIDDAVVRFRPTGTYLKTRELADLLGNDPTERAQYLALMNNVLQVYDKQAQTAGMQNDLAMALSFFFGENARIYHGLPEPPDAQFMDLRNMIARGMAEEGILRNASDRQKQEMWETLVAYTGLTLFGYEQAKQAGQEAMVRGYQQVAGQNLQVVTHLSPDGINFTANGLTISNTPSDSTAFSQSSSAGGAADAPIAGVIEAVQLAHAYEINEIDANARFTRRRIRVAGVVEDTQVEEGRMVLHFVQGNDAYANYSLTCYLLPSQQTAAASLRRHEHVVVEGVSKGRTDLYKVTLDSCEIVSR
ncbi:MAG: OB-fold putative lipoprotein [Acidobacteriia bacterium]|nr:OB-fold putative lipoprotein [Terriglobia bacterium]